MSVVFALEFEPLSAEHGWMDSWLTIKGKRKHVDVTSVFPPFADFVKFLRAVASGQLPYSFTWLGEGPWIDFHAFPLQPGSATFRLVLNETGTQIMDAILDRMETVDQILDQLRAVAMDCPGADSEWEFPYFLIEEFERDRAQGFVRTPRPRASQARFVFFHCGGYGGLSAPGFCLWIDDTLTLTMFMDDSPRLWKMWFDLLEKIVHSHLPLDENVGPDPRAGDTRDGSDDVNTTATQWIHFHAESVDNPEEVRLQIERMSEDASPYPLGTATFHRKQFVSAFVQAFKEFLKTDYYGFLESGENTLDLRTLPLERLEVP